MAGTVPFKANGNAVVPNLNTCGIATYDMELLTKDSCTWARIFHHNNKKGTVIWGADDTVLYYTSADKFSRLCLLELYRHPAGHFEFMVLQPDDTPNITFRWKQTSNPTTEKVTTGYSTVTGYSSADPGIRRCLNTSTLDTQYAFIYSGETWWGAIGAYWYYQSGNVVGLPGFGNNMVTGSIDLYVRVDNLVDLSSVRTAEKCLYTKDLIEL